MSQVAVNEATKMYLFWPPKIIQKLQRISLETTNYNITVIRICKLQFRILVML